MRKYMDIVENEYEEDASSEQVLGNYTVDLVEIINVDPYYHIRGKLVKMTRGHFKLGKMVIAGYEYTNENKITLNLKGYSDKFSSIEQVREYVKNLI